MDAGQEFTDKKNIIIMAAQRRLGLYGFEKTAMHEIAADVSMSKAALYYYFPDKESIFKAVIEKEQLDFFTRIRPLISSLNNPEDRILQYVRLRIGYFREFMNLSKFRNTNIDSTSPILKELFIKFRNQETLYLIEILEYGRDNGVFHFENARELAELFLDVLKGLRFGLIPHKQYIELLDEELEIVLKRALDFAEIFIKGLRYSGESAKT
jgi:TetR/AcrR family transcriptional regulator